MRAAPVVRCGSFRRAQASPRASRCVWPASLASSPSAPATTRRSGWQHSAWRRTLPPWGAHRARLANLPVCRPFARCRTPHPIARPPCAVDLCLTAWLHTAGRDQGFGLCAIHLGPDAARPARGEPLQPVVRILCFFLAVDPAVAKRNFHRFVVADGGFGRPGLGNLQPHTFRSGMILAQPRFKCACGTASERNGSG